MDQNAAAELFRREPDRYLDVGAGEVAYRRVGDGPDVLFVHGWPVSGATFRCLLPHLVGHVTCHLIDLPSAGSSRFTAATPLSIDRHIQSVRRVVDLAGLDDVAVVGHDSGGLVARHAMVGDPRLRAMGLINTEQPQGLSRRFRLFLAGRRVPGFGAILGWAAGQRRIRRNRWVLGDAFADRSLLDGEFDEFFLQPLHDCTGAPGGRRPAAAQLRRRPRPGVGRHPPPHRGTGGAGVGRPGPVLPRRVGSPDGRHVPRRHPHRHPGCRAVLARGATGRRRRRPAPGADRAALITTGRSAPGRRHRGDRCPVIAGEARSRGQPGRRIRRWVGVRSCSRNPMRS